MTDSVSPAPAPAAPKAALFIVFVVVFIDLLGFAIVLPLLPRYAEGFLRGVDPMVQGITIGLLFSVFSAMQFFFSPALGRLSDRIGRRPVILLSLGGSVVFYGLFAIASSMTNQPVLGLTLMFLSRIGAGIAGASVSTAQAVIADCTTPEKRSKGMALIGAAFGIGFTFGPLIAWAGESAFDDADWGPGAMASLLSLIAFILAARMLPETRNPSGAPAAKEFFSISRTVQVLSIPTVGTLILIYFLAIFGFANFEGTLSLLTKEAFGMGRRDNYLVFAFVGFVLMVAQGGLYRRFAGKVSEESLLAVGLVLMLLGLGGLAVVAWMSTQPDAASSLGTRKMMFYIVMACAVTGFAFVNPSVASLVSRRSDPNRQGEVLGVNQSFAALGRILGPLMGLALFPLDSSHVLPYVAASGLLLIVAALLPRVWKSG